MRKVMLLAAMLAMVLAAAVPAFAQSVSQDGNVCVQNALQVEIGKTQINQYGDNINIQNIAQECNVTVTHVQEVVAAAVPGVTATASATASPAAEQYPAAVQYQYASPTATASPAAELPATGGASLLAVGAGVLLVAGGLLARRIVR